MSIEDLDPNLPMDEWEFDDPNEELFFSVGWATVPGVSGNFLNKIKSSLESGADINGINDKGRTPLTEAIDGSSHATHKAVGLLLELGADPSKRDKNGYTPWTACISRIHDNVVSDIMEKIKQLLIENDADQNDEVLLKFNAAVQTGNIQKIKELLSQNIDIHSPIVGALHIATRNNDTEMVKFLVTQGFDINSRSHEPDGETCLIQASQDGNLEMVKLLVELGADVNLFAWGDPQCTADFIAEDEDHKEIAAWLGNNLPQEAVQAREEKAATVPTKFKIIYEKKTNGINCEITNDDVIKKLTKWDDQFKINISNVEVDGLTVEFENLPGDLELLAKEIYEFCPDIIDQGYGCMDDMVEMAEEYGQEIPKETLKLIEGIDFNDENFGLKILQRELKDKKTMGFWWD